MEARSANCTAEYPEAFDEGKSSPGSKNVSGEPDRFAAEKYGKTCNRALLCVIIAVVSQTSPYGLRRTESRRNR